MRLELNADEIFRIAEKIEENGAKFYEIAAEGMTDRETAWELLELAQEELEHQKTFEKMRESFAKSGTEWSVETSEHSDLFLQSWADGHVFRVDKNPFENMTGDESVSDILEMAINAEKDSIVFYLGIKEALPSKADRDKVERLIWEELNHYAKLSNKLARLDGLAN
jgi:rubrerythrin